MKLVPVHYSETDAGGRAREEEDSMQFYTVSTTHTSDQN